MHFVPAAKNTMLGALTIDRASLHTGIPDDTGSLEVTGGSPAYARVTISMDAASGGSRSMETVDPDPTFDVPAGTDAVAVGFWTNAGSVFHGWAPAKGADIRGTARVLNTGDVLQCFAHGLANGNRLLLRQIYGQAVPAGLSASTLYYVVGATTDDFQVSATLGGAAVTITGDGEIGWVRLLVESFVGQGQLPLQTAVLDLNG